MRANLQKHVGFAILLIAFALFIPGIYLTMFALNMDMNIGVSGTNINAQMLNKELSIVNTVKELWNEDRMLVAVLIFVFSVVIPILKTMIVCFVYFAKDLKKQLKLINFVGAIGKWSMADVFVVAVFLAVMSTNHANNSQQENVAFFGMRIGVQISTETISYVGQGFYYFLSYCLLSIVATQLISRSVCQKELNITSHKN